MDLIQGVSYNIRGLKLSLRTPRLLFLGMLRLVMVMVITVVLAGLIAVYHREILGAFWARPESAWVAWLWHLASWLTALALIGFSAIFSYLAAQILFSVLIMDLMSRMTETMVRGKEESPQASLRQQVGYLILQEIPRAVLPLLLSAAIFAAGWLTPLGPIAALVSSAAAAVFLAWDNTDLVPARRMAPFSERFRLLRRSLSFHLGFGALFLIPVVNILLLSFAPVGATLYFIERHPAYRPASPSDRSAREKGTRAGKA